MFTIEYKGYYIHGYINKPECHVNKPMQDGGVFKLGVYRSLLAAKQAITKHIKAGT